MRHASVSAFTDALPLAARDGFGAVSQPAGALAAILRWLAWPHRVVRIRREMALLGQMSARELADVGLSRQDVWDAASLPLGRSPDGLLTGRAAERRKAAGSRG